MQLPGGAVEALDLRCTDDDGGDGTATPPAVVTAATSQQVCAWRWGAAPDDLASQSSAASTLMALSPAAEFAALGDVSAVRCLVGFDGGLR